MTKLSRNADGSYRGTYGGHEFTVRKETMDDGVLHRGEVWVARASEIVAAGWKHQSRNDVIEQLQRQLDEAAVDVPPEIDAVLRRWAEAIKAVMPGLNSKDPEAAVTLEGLRHDLRRFEHEFRQAAVRIERRLGHLRARG